MPVRQKTAFEKWFSFSRHKRRHGANQLDLALSAERLTQLKQNLVPVATKAYTFGSKTSVLEHIEDLKAEFAGEPELNHYHASLIVLIRREVDAKKNYQTLRALWEVETEFLCQSLSVRWLVSACDTFVDHDPDPVLRALAMQVAVLINTLKVTETERLCMSGVEQFNTPPEYKADVVEQLGTDRFALFDGVSALAVGTDDTLRNMRWRLESTAKLHPLGAVVVEVFDRLQDPELSTPYSRLKDQHKRPRTKWW